MNEESYSKLMKLVKDLYVISLNQVQNRLFN
jgi:hypothetical protein